MKFRHFPGLEKDLSVLALGTMRLDEQDPGTVDELLGTWFEAGGTVLDCAHEYGGGSSERAVGAWLEAMDCRDEAVVITKGCHPYGNGPRVTAEYLSNDLTESLSRLRTERVDLYLLHRDDVSVPVGPLLEALEAQRRAGLIRTYGASNWTLERLEEAESYAVAHGLSGFSASSPNVSLADPCQPLYPGAVSACDPESRQWYRKHGLAVFAWSAQAGGFFLDPPPTTGSLTAYDTPENAERRRRAEIVAARQGCLAHHVALAWTLHQPFRSFSIIGPRSAAELRSSLVALEVELTEHEVAWLALEVDG